MSQKDHRMSMRILSWILFALYIAVLVYFMFFSDMLGRTDTTQAYEHNLILFREIRRFWTYRSRFGFFSVFLNLAGNVLVFMPFGLLLPIMSKKLKGFFRVVLLGFILSLAVESIPLATGTGCFDVDDLLLNTIGAALGFLIYVLLSRRRQKRGGGNKMRKRRR